VNDVVQRRPGTHQVQIRTVGVITDGGRSITPSSVRCPVRARTAPVEECAPCGQSTGIAQDVPSGGRWLCCQAGPRAEQAGDGPPVRAAMRTAVAFRPGLAASIAAEALRARGQPGAPVVDGEGRPVSPPRAQPFASTPR
jgi:hypothetical protein